ncbi:GNAT family N-acetyltransferase [Bacteriovorax sp. PP10]|uniref:GNAT family N-acetyltransferase n=1 Tax=Bacteriovorax antarcticus TaxID=3088717 RepID=A0ABU5VS83_9BACT|nr:GNAT family N-acetyltransferase [Bacteriovorax sp. PP10]MEA9355861.1 GNAT family N-acetyltransferase [Bacteriovorax sp. PP10]
MKEDFFEIRQILPEDKIPLQVGLQMLSPESIRQRFFASKKEFTENELKFLTEVDQINHLAYVAVHHLDGKLLPGGVIRAIKDSQRPTYAEIGITIVDSYQGKGLGIQLFNTISDRALQVGLTHFYGQYHTSNLKMTKLLEKFAKTRAPLFLKHTGDGFIYFEAPLKN